MKTAILLGLMLLTTLVAIEPASAHETTCWWYQAECVAQCVAHAFTANHRCLIYPGGGLPPLP